MRLFDKTAFLQKIGGVDAGIVEANIHTIGLVAGDMDENGRKALANFVQFIVRTDCQNLQLQINLLKSILRTTKKPLDKLTAFVCKLHYIIDKTLNT